MSCHTWVYKRTTKNQIANLKPTDYCWHNGKPYKFYAFDLPYRIGGYLTNKFDDCDEFVEWIKENHIYINNTDFVYDDVEVEKNIRKFWGKKNLLVLFG